MEQSRNMKIVAGLGSVDEYSVLAKAGADEMFCGYVPASWYFKYGNLSPLNRREVRYVHVQIGAWEEMRILSRKKEEMGIPIHLTFNSLSYSGEQYKEIAAIIDQCMQIGFDTFIIADPALILYLREQKIGCRIHLSGETAEINTPFLQKIASEQIKRVIFHRKNTLEDMQVCVRTCGSGISEYEAFFLNEKCHFTGGYCNSLHCDEVDHICHLPYVLGNRESGEGNRLPVKGEELLMDSESGSVIGETGCGLCALWQLRAAGITHLKLVGRGNYIDCMRKDVEAAREALHILEESETAERYIKEMQNRLFTGLCSGNCYYPNQSMPKSMYSL